MAALWRSSNSLVSMSHFSPHGALERWRPLYGELIPALISGPFLPMWWSGKMAALWRANNSLVSMSHFSTRGGSDKMAALSRANTWPNFCAISPHMERWRPYGELIPDLISVSFLPTWWSGKMAPPLSRSNTGLISVSQAILSQNLI